MPADSPGVAAGEGNFSGVVWYSRFDPDGEGGGGGCRREAQLRLMLAELDSRVESSRLSPRATGKLRNPRRWLWNAQMRFHPFRRFWADDPMRLAAMRMYGAARDWARAIGQVPRPRLAVVTDPLFFSPLVVKLHAAGIPVVGLCQNLESLGYDQLNPRFQLKLVNMEWRLLSKCSVLITISREEQFVLRNLDLPAIHVPYCPIPREMERFRSIRAKRSRTGKSDFLLLGTAGNKCTRDGMHAVVNAWKRIPSSKRKGEKLLVAGYWTRLMGEGVRGNGVDFLGEISDSRLEDLLCSVRALICFQEHGGGALTRIPEMIIAGVPVLANMHALRSHHELAGAECFPDLRSLVAGALGMVDGRRITVPDHQVSPPDPDPIFRRIRNLVDMGKTGEGIS